MLKKRRFLGVEDLNLQPTWTSLIFLDCFHQYTLPRFYETRLSPSVSQLGAQSILAQAFWGLEASFLNRCAKVGHFLFPCINTHSLVFTRHDYLRPLRNEAEKAFGLKNKWEIQCLAVCCDLSTFHTQNQPISRLGQKIKKKSSPIPKCQVFPDCWHRYEMPHLYKTRISPSVWQ